MTGLIQLLSLPRQLRKDNCYKLQLVRWILAYDVKTVPVTKSVSDSLDKPWTAVAGGNFGLDLT